MVLLAPQNYPINAKRATAYFARLFANCRCGAHSDRPELAHAKSFLAGD